MPDDKNISPKIEKPAGKSEKPIPADKNILEKLGTLPEKEKSVSAFRDLKKVVLEELKQTEKIIPAKSIGIPALTEEQKQRQKQVEKILEAGLDDIYRDLSPAKQLEFKIEGEQAAKQINNLLEKAKVKIKDIIKIIMKWLKVIPGVNRFFLEQEAKIKADEILKISAKGGSASGGKVKSF